LDECFGLEFDVVGVEQVLDPELELGSANGLPLPADVGPRVGWDQLAAPNESSG
jgi:hypothetical protein